MLSVWVRLKPDPPTDKRALVFSVSTVVRRAQRTV
jgi:hypothetical protein